MSDADKDPPDLGQLADPWPDPDAEYRVLTDLLVPAVQGRAERTLQDWDALDTKAMGLITVAAASIAGLAAVHDTINRLWWLPTAGFFVAGGMLVASIWPRTVDLGPDLVDLHDEMRGQDPTVAA